MTLQEAWDQAEATGRGFRVERIASTTYLRDCITIPAPRETAANTLGYTRREQPLYRCRIGRGRWIYGDTAVDAIRKALSNFADA
jgi:hypothetical protein